MWAEDPPGEGVSGHCGGRGRRWEGDSEDTLRGRRGERGRTCRCWGRGSAGGPGDVRISDRLAIGPNGELPGLSSPSSLRRTEGVPWHQLASCAFWFGIVRCGI